MEEEDISKAEPMSQEKAQLYKQVHRSLEDGKIFLKQKEEKIAQDTKSTF